jgi:hypothetical protein
MRGEYIRRADAMGKITSSETQKALRAMTGEEAYVAVVGILNELPAADVLPVVHGRWVTHYRSGTPVARGYVSTCCDMWNNRKSDYCPNCGAKMDGGNENV